MKKLIFLIIISLVLFSSNIFAEKNELLEVPQRYQGIWRVVALSSDLGKTKINGNGAAFCKVSAMHVLNDQGTTITISQVIQQIVDNVEYTGLYFDNDIVWIISDLKDSYILVQTLQVSTGEERIRVIFFISK